MDEIEAFILNYINAFSITKTASKTAWNTEKITKTAKTACNTTKQSVLLGNKRWKDKRYIR